MNNPHRIACCLLIILNMVGTTSFAQTNNAETEKCPYQLIQNLPIKDNPSITAKDGLAAIKKVLDDNVKINNAFANIRTEFYTVKCEYQLEFWRETIVLGWQYLTLNDFLNNFRGQGGRMMGALLNFSPHWDPTKKILFEDISEATNMINGLIIQPGNKLPDHVDSLITLAIDKITWLNASIESGISSLGDYNKEVNARLDSMTTYLGKFRTYKNLDHEKLMKMLANAPCGSQEMQDKWSTGADAMKSTLDNVMPTLAGYGLSKTDIDNDITEIFTPLNTLLNYFNQVRCDLWNAEKATGVEKTLKIEVAKKFWDDSVLGLIKREYGDG